jgi:hypothetical protein
MGTSSSAFSEIDSPAVGTTEVGRPPLKSAYSQRATKVVAIRSNTASLFVPLYKVLNLFLTSSTVNVFAFVLVANRSANASFIPSASMGRDLVRSKNSK